MWQRFPHIAAGVVAASLTAVSPVRAFDVPDGQSCGGLVCDLGLFGHKTAPAPAAPAVAAPAAPIAKAPSMTKTPIAERPSPVSAEPRKVATRRKTHVAKAVASAPAERKAAAAPLGAPPLAAALVPAPTSRVPPPAPASPAAPSPIAAVLEPVPPAAPAVPVTPPARAEPTVLANPYVYTRPLPFMFQSVDPTQGVQ